MLVDEHETTWRREISGDRKEVVVENAGRSSETSTVVVVRVFRVRVHEVRDC